MSSGASAVPVPSRALRVRTERSWSSGRSRAANVLSAGTVVPNPKPRAPVAPSSTGYAADDGTASLSTSSTIATRFATSPTCSTRCSDQRAASSGDVAAPVMARTTCGTNISPYWVVLRSYPVGLTRIELAAGNDTSARPWTSPAP